MRRSRSPVRRSPVKSSLEQKEPGPMQRLFLVQPFCSFPSMDSYPSKGPVMMPNPLMSPPASFDGYRMPMPLYTPPAAMTNPGTLFITRAHEPSEVSMKLTSIGRLFSQHGLQKFCTEIQAYFSSFGPIVDAQFYFYREPEPLE